MKDWVDYIRTVDGEHHGWRQMFHYGDWLALDRAGASEGNAYGATDEGYVADVYYAASADIVAKAADILGRKIPGACGPAVAGGKTRILYVHRPLRRKNPDRTPAGSEISYLFG